MLIYLTALLIAMGSASVPSPKTSKPRKPKVELRASPRMVQDSVFGQKPILLTLIITNANEEFWCPQIIWKWPGDTESVEEGDCPPFEQAPKDELERKSWTRFVPIVLPPGKWTIGAVLQKSEKTIVTVEVVVVVMGDGP